RRRHTRSYGDWSSDVCSSDLSGGRFQQAPIRPPATAGTVNSTARTTDARRGVFSKNPTFAAITDAVTRRPKVRRSPPDHDSHIRSEERRVGKELMPWGCAIEA